MSLAVQERPLDISFAQSPNGEISQFVGTPGSNGANAGDFIRSQYSQSPWPSGNGQGSWQAPFSSIFGFVPGGNIIEQLYQMLQQFFSNQGSGEQYFQNANGGSVGDPHLSFNGQTWNNMGSQPDLLHSDSIAGGYQLSTQTTAPSANGVTYNQSATVTMNGGSTSVTMDKSGTVSISQFGNTFSLQPGQSVDLGNREFVQRNQDGSLAITCNNGSGGNITTTMRSNGTGVDVNATTNNVDLGGALVGGPSGQTPPPAPVPTPLPIRREPFPVLRTY